MKPWICLICLLPSLSAFAGSGTTLRISDGFICHYPADAGVEERDRFRDRLSAAKRVCSLLARQLKPAKPSLDVQMEVGADGEQKNTLKLRIRSGTVELKVPADVFRSSPELQRQLLGILLLAELGYPPSPGYRHLPGWLLQAIEQKIDNRLQEDMIPGPDIYPRLHGAVMVGKTLPGINWLLDPGPEKGDPALYREVSTLLLDRILNCGVDGERALLAYLDPLQNSREDDRFEEYLEPVIRKRWNRMPLKPDPDDASGGSPLEEWFEFECMNGALNPFTPCDSRYALREFEHLFDNIRYRLKAAGPDTTVSRETGSGELPAEDASVEKTKTAATTFSRTAGLGGLMSDWKKIENPEKVTRQIRTRLSILRYRVPSLLLPPLDELLRAVADLDKGDPEAFKEKLGSGREKFMLEYQRLVKIETLLNELEYTRLPLRLRYPDVFQESHALQRRERTNWPQLQKYLDQLEAEGKW